MGIEYLLIIAFLCLSMEFCCCCFINEGYSEKNISLINKHFAIFIFFIMMILTTFRSASIGNDTNVYVYVFNNVCKGIQSGEFLRFGIGYQKLNILLSYISDSPQAIIIATSLICYILIALYLFRHVDNKLLFVIIFYSLMFSNFTNIIRQAIAMSILIFAYEYSIKKRNIISIILTLFATAFHYAAVVFLLYILLKNIKITKKAAFFSFLIVMALSLMAENILLNWFIKMFPLYESYLTGERVGTGHLGVTINLVVLLILFLMYYLPRKGTAISGNVLWLFVFCASFTVLSYVMNNFTRVAYVFYLPIIKECCMYLPKGTKKNCMMEFIGTMALLAVFVTIIVFRPEWNSLYPYFFYTN